MVISRLNDYGKYNGITIINICDIVSLNCDSKDSKDLLLLSRA